MVCWYFKNLFSCIFILIILKLQHQKMTFFKYIDHFLLVFGIKFFTHSRLIRLINLSKRILVVLYMIFLSIQSIRKMFLNSSFFELEGLFFQITAFLCLIRFILIA